MPEPRTPPPSAVWSERRERTLRRLSLAIGTVVAFALGEGLLRVAARGSSAADLARTAGALPPPVQGDCRTQRRQALLGEIIRPSPLHDLVYELKPSLDTCFAEARVRTDADGRRISGPPARAGVPSRRILFLGDSQAFGWGLEEGETVGARLAAELDPSDHGAVQVINAGVPGYNAAQEATFLATRGLSYRPDCVLVLYIGNDLGAPSFLPRPRAGGGRSLLLARLAWFFAAGTRAAADDPWWDQPTLEDTSFVGDGNRVRVPPEYRHLVGVDGYRRALDVFGEAARRGITVVNFADYAGDGVDWGALIDHQESRGVLYERPGARWGEPAFSLSAYDAHLNARGAADLARRMAAALRRRQVCLPPS